ncbi:MAG TPA: M1 family metallopeptidase [Gemmatimonadaceae bacterium]|nr:M1 family metallopeptidase [Gemmatimonadaceae bacterium]
MRTSITLVVGLLVSIVTSPVRGQSSSTTSPSPTPQVQHPPDREYDLQHIALDMSVDYARSSFTATVINTLAPLHDGLKTITFACGAGLNVEAISVDGHSTTFSRNGDTLRITAPASLARGKSVRVLVRYSAEGDQGDGFHWIKPTATDSNRVGFWTNGEPNHNHEWLPTWEYPNDLTTSEETITVPAKWFVFGNGGLISNVVNAGGRTRTLHWQMQQRHATYLLSLGAGLFDMELANWRGVPLIYAGPRGKGPRIDDTFGETPQLLSFYSDHLGVKYPWAKYAEFGAYDFDNAVQYVSATMFDERYLADKRFGPHFSSGVVAHEMAHQWFGNLVTPKQWGELWLSEGFATFFGQALYSEHWRGKADYDHVIEDFSQDYFAESRSYKRPLSTDVYRDVGAMYDTHSYRKGAAVLHTLRRYLGDTLFYRGISHYLKKYRNSLVDSHDFCAAMSEGTGVDLQRFCDQWIFKPGHPVLDYEWTWDDPAKAIVLTIRQIQDTTSGTPVYDLKPTVGWITGGRVMTRRISVDKGVQILRVPMANKPDAVLLDPDHDFLRELPALHWAPEELPYILRYAPDAVDREQAMTKILEGSPSDATVHAIAEELRADTAQFPVFRSLSPLVNLRRADLRPLFRDLVAHSSIVQRYYAILGLDLLGKDSSDVRTLRNLVTDQQPFRVVRAAVQTFRDWDAAGNRDAFSKAIQILPREDPTRLIAYDGLAKADSAAGRQPAGSDPRMTANLRNLLSDIANGRTDSPLMTQGLRGFASRPSTVKTVASWLGDLKSFTFLTVEDVAQQGMERRGGKVQQIWYYKMVTGHTAQYLIFYVTADGGVTDVDVSRE